MARRVCGDENRKVLMAKIATNIFWTMRAEPEAICLWRILDAQRGSAERAKTKIVFLFFHRL
jgi:hypothetical protein